MPYDSKSELPQQIKDNLPDQAQDIWKEAFKSAIKSHSEDDDAEQTASKIAWSAVKQSYHKNEDGNWVKND